MGREGGGGAEEVYECSREMGVIMGREGRGRSMNVPGRWGNYGEPKLGGGGEGIYPLNSPITKTKLVNSPITKNSKLFHQPLSRVTKISCITIHHLKDASITNHQELKSDNLYFDNHFITDTSRAKNIPIKS